MASDESKQVLSEFVTKQESSSDEELDLPRGAAISKKRQTIKRFLFVGLPIAICLSALLIGAYFVYVELQKQQALLHDQGQALYQQQLEIQANAGLIAKNTKAGSGLQGAFDVKLSTVKQRLSDAEKRIFAQNRRLLSMSTTSRDDWLLAEAQYLLKLANQRVLIENSADGADALLAEADAILRDLDEPDLHMLRRAIAGDLAALRLAKRIDVEGIYLNLVALAERVDLLPLNRQSALTPIIPTEQTLDKVQSESLTWKEGLSQSFSRFVDSLSGLYKVRSDAEPPRPLLPPDANTYISQNLRLILEKTQLALLREQQDIYKQSLAQAQAILWRYYPDSELRTAFSESIVDLQNRVIVTELPNISTSLNLLHAYIDELHQLNGVSRPSTNGQGAQ